MNNTIDTSKLSSKEATRILIETYGYTAGALKGMSCSELRTEVRMNIAFNHA